MHTNLKTVSGCATRLTVTVTAPEGADKTLTAYCRCCGDSHPATVEGDTVTFPPLPAGEHLFELRAGGVPVIHGHLIARPSAFPVPPMHTVDHTVTADLDGTTVANLSVTLNQGARGPQGEPGAPGEAPRLPWEMTTGVGDSNANVATMVLHQKYLTPGLLTEVSIMARPNNTAGQGVAMQVLQQQEGGGNNPEGWELLGTSTNAVNQVFNTYGTWEFDGIILAAGRPVCFKTVNADGASTNIGLKGFGRPADDTVSCIRAASGTSANYIPQAIIRMRQDAAAALADTNAALAAHSEDSTAHVTAGEHAVLANAAQGALWVPGSTGSVTLAGQQGDGVAVSAANNTSRVQVQNSGVTITAPNAPQWLEAGDTPAFYNIRTAKDLTATDASIAAAMAATNTAVAALEARIAALEAAQAGEAET